jgi:hypothetical protein
LEAGERLESVVSKLPARLQGLMNTNCIESMISIARDTRSSLRSPVTSKLLHGHAILHESHEKTNGRPTAPKS